MKKLLNKYNEECSIKTNHANIIWKAGVILNSIIIGTLFLIIWEIAVERSTENIGFWDMLPIAVIYAIVLSAVIGWISKEIIEDRKIFNQFERYMGNKRLEELLLEVALKCKK